MPEQPFRWGVLRGTGVNISVDAWHGKGTFSTKLTKVGWSEVTAEVPGNFFCIEFGHGLLWLLVTIGVQYWGGPYLRL